MTALAYAAVILVLLCCCAYAYSVQAGHRAACLRRTALVHWLIVWTLACIAAVYAWRTARHPLRYGRYLAARVIRRIPRRDPDGEPLSRDDMRAFIGIVESWRQPAAPERSRT